MIISASYRSDIPAFHGDWFRARLAAGHCRIPNPYGGPPSDVSLKPSDVTGFVFWTRNSEPFARALEDVTALNIPFSVSFTVTGYPRPLDAATISVARAARQLAGLQSRFGARVAVWRYDPIVISSLTPSDWHLRNFTALVDRLAGSVDEVCISFMQVYRKTKTNMNRASRDHGFNWTDPPAIEKQDLLTELAGIAAKAGLRMTLCGQPELLVDGVEEATCIDIARLSDLAGQPLSAPQRSHRIECRCAASRDIGIYDSCPQGCAYCYAVRNRDTAKRKIKRRDP